MTRTEAVVLALRIGALYLVLIALLHMADLVIAVAAWGGIVGIAPSWLAAIAARGLLGLALFLVAPRIARKMAGGEEPLRLEDHSETGSLALRVAGIVLWDAALSLMSSLNGLASSDEDRTHVFTVLGMMLVITGTGIWLFRSAPRIGARLFGSRAAHPTSRVDATLTAIVFAGAGLWIVANNLGGFATSLVDAITYSVQEGFRFRNAWVDVIASGLRLVLGAFLFLGAGSVSSVWHRLRTAGLQPRNDTA